MSYTPNVWQAGDVVTPAKLNHIEEGIANCGSLVVHVTQTEEGSTTYHTLDQTWQTITDALAAGVPVMVVEAVSWQVTQRPIYETSVYDGTYTVTVSSSSGSTKDYTVNDPDGYAYYTTGGK